MKQNLFGTLLKNKLDERQEQELLRIEHRGFWVLYIALIVLYLAEMFQQSDPFCTGLTFVILIGISVYTGVACMRRGIWGRYYSKPSLAKNLLVSLAAGLVVAVFALAVSAKEGLMELDPTISFLIAAAGGLFTLLLCLASLQISAVIYRTRNANEQKEMDKEEK